MFKYNYRLGFIIIILLRIAAPFLVFSNVLFTIVSVLFLDIIDGLHASRGGIRRRVYQNIDKAVDLLWYIVMLAYIYSSNEMEKYTILLTLLFAFRLLGILLFWATGIRKLLFVFANFYENIFILIVLGVFVPGLEFIVSESLFPFSIVVAVVLRIIQEYFAHIVTYSFTERFLRIKMYWKD